MVKRYRIDANNGGVPVPSESGEWVRAEEAESRRQERDAAYALLESVSKTVFDGELRNRESIEKLAKMLGRNPQHEYDRLKDEWLKEHRANINQVMQDAFKAGANWESSQPENALRGEEVGEAAKAYSGDQGNEVKADKIKILAHAVLREISYTQKRSSDGTLCKYPAISSYAVDLLEAALKGNLSIDDRYFSQYETMVALNNEVVRDYDKYSYFDPDPRLPKLQKEKERLSQMVKVTKDKKTA